MLDHILPLYQIRPYHDTVVTATPEAALDALLSLPARSDGVVATLFALRGLRGRGTLRDLIAGMGLHPVTTDREYAGAFSPTPDGLARAGFALYWLVIGPFSALIRRRWLAAAKRAAERGALS